MQTVCAVDKKDEKNIAKNLAVLNIILNTHIPLIIYTLYSSNFRTRCAPLCPLYFRAEKKPEHHLSTEAQRTQRFTENNAGLCRNRSYNPGRNIFRAGA